MSHALAFRPWVPPHSEKRVQAEINGLRIGTPGGGAPRHDRGRRTLASFIARGLARDADPASIAPEVTAWRGQFTGVHFTADNPHGKPSQREQFEDVAQPDGRGNGHTLAMSRPT